MNQPRPDPDVTPSDDFFEESADETPRKTGVPRSEDTQTYELAVPEEELDAPAAPAAKPTAPPPTRRSAAGTYPATSPASTRAAPTKPAPAERQPTPPQQPLHDSEGKAIPAQYAEEPEPAYVDPEIAARRREEARIRAAEAAAIEDARRRKRVLLIAGAVIALALVLLIVSKFW